MKYQDLGAATGTSHTLSFTPISQDHVWPIYQTLWCERVTSSPGVLQFTVGSGSGGVAEPGVFEPGVVATSGGTDLVFGFSKRDIDTAGIFIEDDSNNMLIPEVPVGLKNGANKTFTITRPIPPGTEPIVVYDGVILHPTTGLGANEYLRTGQSFVLSIGHPAPTATTDLRVLVTAPKITNALFTKQTISGTKNGVKRFFSLVLPEVAGYNHHGILNQMARAVLPSTEEAPDSTEFIYDQPSALFEVGTPPAATDAFHFWATGLELTVDRAFQIWQDSGLPRIYLGEINLARTPPGYAEGAYAADPPELITLRVATRAYYTEPTDTPANTVYLPYLKGMLRVRRSIESSLTGHTTVSYSDLLLANPVEPGSTLGVLDEYFGSGGYFVDGQFIKIDITGEPRDLAYADRETIYQAVAKPAVCSAREISIPIQDLGGRLTRTLPLIQLTPEEFPNLPEANIGRYRPYLIGYISNMQPILVDPLTQTWIISGHPCQALPVVKENGYPVPFTFNQTTRDRFTLPFTPQGQITCDVQGSRLLNGTFSGKLAHEIEDLLKRWASYAASNINSIRLRLFHELCPWDVQLAIYEPKTLQEILDILLDGIPCFYFLSRQGTFVLRVLEDPSGRHPHARFVAEIDSLIPDTPNFTTLSPIYRTTIAYGHNETVQSSGLALAVSDADREFLKKAFSTVSADEQAIRVIFPESIDEPQLVSRLYRRADAEALAAMRLAYFRKPRTKVRESFDVIPLRLDLGGEIGYTALRYNLGLHQNVWTILTMDETLGVENALSRVEMEFIQ